MLDETTRVPETLPRPLSRGSSTGLEPNVGVLGDTLLRAETTNVGEGFVVVHLYGELDVASAPALMRGLIALFALPLQSMTIDLSAVGFLDSSGISVLNATRITAEDRNVRLILDDVPAHARRVLEVAGMSALFEFHESADHTGDIFE